MVFLSEGLKKYQLFQMTQTWNINMNLNPLLETDSSQTSPELQFSQLNKTYPILIKQEQTIKSIVKPTIMFVNRLKDLCILVEKLEFSPTTKFLFRSVLESATGLERQLYFNNTSLSQFRQCFNRNVDVFHITISKISKGRYDDIVEEYHQFMVFEIMYLQQFLFLFLARLLKSLKYLFIQKINFSKSARSYYQAFLQREYDLWEKCLTQLNYYRYGLATKIRINIRERKSYLERISRINLNQKDIQAIILQLGKIAINSKTNMQDIKHNQSLFDKKRCQFEKVCVQLINRVANIENYQLLQLLQAITRSINNVFKKKELSQSFLENEKIQMVSIKKLEEQSLDQQNNFIRQLGQKLEQIKQYKGKKQMILQITLQIGLYQIIKLYIFLYQFLISFISITFTFLHILQILLPVTSLLFTC